MQWWAVVVTLGIGMRGFVGRRIRKSCDGGAVAACRVRVWGLVTCSLCRVRVVSKVA
jgi:hypothetical protein